MARSLIFFLLATNLFTNLVTSRPITLNQPTTEIQVHFARSPLGAVSFATIEPKFAESPLTSHHSHHKPFDKSFAGGKVILGGVFAAILVAVFCYIRITRRSKSADVVKS
ncbi:hypothetical protein LUZ60_010656 [Juncus effusus]|nr:hypothetical protein LUZ60_010656 [Juncus effusus]